MRESLRRLLVWLLLTTPAVSAAPYDSTYDQAAGYGVETLENRVQRLEKRFSGQAMAKMLADVEKLQAEVLKLRGELEKAQNEIERLRKLQKDDYATLDQRLQQIVTNQSVMQAQMQAAAPPVPTAAPPAGEGSDAAAGSVTAGAGPGLTPPQPAPVEAAPPAPREVAYQKAFATLKDGKYSEAIQEFRNFLTAYPSGDYSDNAQYWLAEAYYVTKDYGAARLAFDQVIKAFPQSAKVADALLKVGLIDYDRGQYADARAALADVVKRYPGSSAAKLAEKRLDRMQQEGR